MKLALAALGLALAVVWVTVAFVLYQEERAAIESASADGRNLARSLAEYEASSVRAIDFALQDLRGAWTRERRAFAAAIERYATHLQREQVIQVAVVDAEGWVVYSRKPSAERVNLADREYFIAQKNAEPDELYISAPVLGRVTGQMTIQFTRRLTDARGGFAGLAIITVPPPALERVYNDIDLGPDGVVVLARGDGTILARNRDFAKSTATSLAGVPGVGDEGPASGGFIAPARVDGVERLYSYRKVEGHPLTVFVGKSVDGVLAPYRKLRTTAFAGGLLATLLLAAVTLFVVFRQRQQAGVREARERLMLELHDGAIQSIYAIGLELENARRHIEAAPTKTAKAMGEAAAELNLVIQDLRAFITDTPQQAPTARHFRAELARILPSPGDGVPAFEVDIDEALVGTLTSDQASHVLRIMREAVSNIMRHAGAKHVRISLQAGDRTARLEIADDGRGFAPGVQAGSGLGLHHIRVRGRKLRGRAGIESAPAAGTRVVAEFPRGA